MKIVIRAGGIGTRLWPMSRKNNPKQFQPIVSKNSNLLETYLRIKNLLKTPADLFISVNQKFSQKIKKEIPQIQSKNIIVETDTRNTGPAMCLEVCFLEKYCQPTDIIATIPSDDYISDNQKFQQLLLEAEKFLAKNPEYIITPGVAPTCIDTGYSYIKSGKVLNKNPKINISQIKEWIEKPDYQRCLSLIKKGNYFCHTGMYIWQLGYIAKLFATMQPKMYKACQQIVNLMTKPAHLPKIKKIYSQFPKDTIESTITNHCTNIIMITTEGMGWSDLGKWHIIKKMLSKSESANLIKGEVLTQESNNNLIFNNNPKKLIIANDINNLVIVDTKDVLLVSSLEKSAEVKKIVELLESKKLDQYL